MNPKHEKYLLGEMDEAERTAMEREFEQNPGLREQFELDRAFLESLHNLMLRRRIDAALSTSDDPEVPVNARGKLWIWFCLAVLAVVVAWFVWRQLSGHQPIEPKEVIHPEKSGAPIAVSPHIPDHNKLETATENKKTTGPIAQVSVEPHSLRGLRGNVPGRTPWETLVLQIWDAPFPASPASFGARFRPIAGYLQQNNTADAFLLLRKMERQEPGNDTLAFLKGYCLMQMWEGEGALQSFNAITGKPSPWSAEVDWYEGLCLLLMGEKEKAVAVLKRIAGQPRHSYRDQAGKALQMMDEK